MVDRELSNVLQERRVPTLQARRGPTCHIVWVDQLGTTLPSATRWEPQRWTRRGGAADNQIISIAHPCYDTTRMSRKVRPVLGKSTGTSRRHTWRIAKGMTLQRQ